MNLFFQFRKQGGWGGIVVQAMCALCSEVTNGSLDRPEVVVWATTNRHRRECVQVMRLRDARWLDLPENSVCRTLCKDFELCVGWRNLVLDLAGMGSRPGRRCRVPACTGMRLVQL